MPMASGFSYHPVVIHNAIVFVTALLGSWTLASCQSTCSRIQPWSSTQLSAAFGSCDFISGTQRAASCAIIPGNCVMFDTPEIEPLVIDQDIAVVKNETSFSSTNEGQEAVLDLGIHLQRVWLLSGSHLRLQGLTLSRALMPSAALIDGGLAPPAPLAFNLSGSSKSSSQLVLEDCTVLAPSCSNLAQFMAWLTTSTASGAAEGVQLRPAQAANQTAWAYIARMRYGPVDLTHVNFTCVVSVSSPPPSAAAAASSSSTAVAVAATPLELLVLLHMAGRLQPTTITIASSMRLYPLWPGRLTSDDAVEWPTTVPATVLTTVPSLRVPTTLLGARAAPFPRVVLDLYLVARMVVLEGGAAGGVLTLRELQLMNLCLASVMFSSSPSVVLSTRRMWAVDFSRKYLGLVMSNVTVVQPLPEVTATQWLYALSPASLGAEAATNWFSQLSAATAAQLGGPPEPPFMVHMNSTSLTWGVAQSSHGDLFTNTTDTWEDPQPGDGFDIMPTYWCSGLTRWPTNIVLFATTTSQDMAAHYGLQMSTVQTSFAGTPSAAPLGAMFSGNASLADAVRMATAELRAAGQDPTAGLITNTTVAVPIPGSPALSAASNTTTSTNASAIDSANDTQPLFLGVSINQMLQGCRLPATLSGLPTAYALNLAGCSHGCLRVKQQSTQFFVSHLTLTGLEPAGDYAGGTVTDPAWTRLALPMWAFGFDRAPGMVPRIHLYNVTLQLPADEFRALLAVLLQPSSPQPSALSRRALTAAGGSDGSSGVFAAVSSSSSDGGLSFDFTSFQLREATPQSILLDNLEGYGFNASLLTIMPTPSPGSPLPPSLPPYGGGGGSGAPPLPQTPPSSRPVPNPPKDTNTNTSAEGSSGGSQGLSSGAKVGIAVGCAGGAVVLVAVLAVVVMVRRQRSGDSCFTLSIGRPRRKAAPAESSGTSASISSSGGHLLQHQQPRSVMSGRVRGSAAAAAAAGTATVQEGRGVPSSPSDGLSAATTTTRGNKSTTASKSETVHPADEVRLLMAPLKAVDNKKLVIKECIGEGGYGSVHKGTWCNMDVAVKTMLFTAGRVGSDRKALALREAAVCCSMHHPNIVTTYHYEVVEVAAPGVVSAGPSGLTISDESTTHYRLYLIQELCDMNLFEMMYIPGGLYHDDAMGTGTRPVMRLLMPLLLDVALALGCLHERNIVHGDLTLNNVMVKFLTGSLQFKVTDFGLCEVLDPGQTHVSQHNKGTPFFAAPEVARHHQVTKGSDVYAYGVLMWCLYNRSMPYEQDPASGRYSAHRAFGRFPPGAPFRYQDLTNQCLHPTPSHRPTFEAILKALSELWQAAGCEGPGPGASPGMSQQPQQQQEQQAGPEAAPAAAPAPEPAPNNNQEAAATPAGAANADAGAPAGTSPTNAGTRAHDDGAGSDAGTDASIFNGPDSAGFSQESSVMTQQTAASRAELASGLIANLRSTVLRSSGPSAVGPDGQGAAMGHG